MIAVAKSVVLTFNKRDIFSAVSFIKNSVRLSVIFMHIAFKTSIHSNNVAV